MAALTIRGISARVEKVIREKAARERVSLNKAIVEMLEESVVGKKKVQPQRYYDLDWMCSSLDEKQVTEFSRNLAKSRVVDKSLWK